MNRISLQAYWFCTATFSRSQSQICTRSESQTSEDNQSSCASVCCDLSAKHKAAELTARDKSVESGCTFIGRGCLRGHAGAKLTGGVKRVGTGRLEGFFDHKC